MTTRTKQPAPKAPAQVGQCTHGPDVRHVGCGGQIWVDAMLYPLVDLGVGFRGGKFVIDKTYGKKICGYSGTCEKCRKSGGFTFSAE
jgi:hypothetical protein